MAGYVPSISQWEQGPLSFTRFVPGWTPMISWRAFLLARTSGLGRDLCMRRCAPQASQSTGACSGPVLHLEVSADREWTERNDGGQLRFVKDVDDAG